MQKLFSKNLLVLAAIIVFVNICVGQDQFVGNPPPPQKITVESDYLSTKEFYLTIIIVVFSLVVLLFYFWLLLKRIKRLRADDILKAFGLCFILTATLVLIVAGFSSQQIAPAIGLFGTIAGYILSQIKRPESRDGKKITASEEKHKTIEGVKNEKT